MGHRKHIMCGYMGHIKLICVGIHGPHSTYLYVWLYMGRLKHINYIHVSVWIHLAKESYMGGRVYMGDRRHICVHVIMGSTHKNHTI